MFGIPVLMLGLLWKRVRRETVNKRTQRTLGFLFSSYSENAYYWEVRPLCLRVWCYTPASTPLYVVYVSRLWSCALAVRILLEIVQSSFTVVVRVRVLVWL